MTAPTVTLHHGDARTVLAELPECSVHAIVTDPPYGLEFMGKEWDRPWAVTPTAGVGFEGREENLTLPSHRDSRNANCRTCGGRQRGKNRCTCDAPKWDRAPGEDMRAFGAWCELWVAECLRVLKPGGHLLAFGGTRTWHRLAVAVEDAGFEIRDSIAWLYGSGFPKSLDVSKAIDKRRTEDRGPVDSVRSWLNARRIDAGFTHDAVNKHFGHASNGGGSSSAWMTNPTSKALPTWDQWQELKSLFGFGDDMDDEVQRLNVRKGADGDNWHSREVVGQYAQSDPRLQSWAEMQGNERGTAKEIRGAPATPEAVQWQGWGTALKPAFEPIVVGRKPLTGTVAANVLAHGTGALNIDGCRIDAGGEDTGRPPGKPEAEGWGLHKRTEASVGNPGGRWPANVVLDEFSADALDQMSGITKSTGGAGAASAATKNGNTYGEYQQPEAGKWKNAGGLGDSGGASRFFYVAKAPAKERPNVDGVSHPTVKPLTLMRWLVRLVTPPGGVVLDPFAGSGTTAEAALIEGFHFTGIDSDPTALAMIRVRLHRQILTLDRYTGPAPSPTVVHPGDPTLFDQETVQ